MRDDDIIAYLEGDDANTGPELDPEARTQLDDLRALLGDGAVWAEPEPNLEQSVVAAVTAAAANDTDAAHTAGAGRVRSHRTRRALLAGAVAVAAAVLLVTFLTRGADQPAAGTRFAAALFGTPLSPNASGTADLAKNPSGWRIDLRAEGLARRDGGKFYEAWMKRADGTLVPVGTFNDARSVTLWSGVSPADFRAFTVTAEVADGDQASSGQRVLTGTLHQTH